MTSLHKLFAFSLIWLVGVCQAAEIQGRVIAITDGDTIKVLDVNSIQHDIRLTGIDAPERKQAFGTASKRSLSDMVYGQQVTVITHKTDRYGRQVGTVLLGLEDVNRKQVEQGMAWFYRQYARELSPADRVAYDQAETEAKHAKRGLWADKVPTPPWLFRKNAP